MSAQFRSEEQCVPLLYLIDPCERIIIFLSPPVIADLIPERSAAQDCIYADHTVKMSVVLSVFLNAYFDIGKRAQKSSDHREILFIDVLSVEECAVNIRGNCPFYFADRSLHSSPPSKIVFPHTSGNFRNQIKREINAIGESFFMIRVSVTKFALYQVNSLLLIIVCMSDRLIVIFINACDFILNFINNDIFKPV